MCFDVDSSPPVPVISGGAVAHQDLVLRADDGAELSAFEALGGGGTGIVVLPDVRGLYRFYEELALRFAERGFDAIAIDYFARTAGLGKRDDDFDFWPHVEQTTFQGVRSDVAAATARLRREQPHRPIVTVGFCFGGSNSWHQAANRHGLSGAIGFYGNPSRAGMPQGAQPVIDRVGDIECPILALQGGDDPGIPNQESRRFRDALDAAEVSNDVVIYEGAPHSFFDRKHDEFAAESSDAWDRVLAFIAEVTDASAKGSVSR